MKNLIIILLVLGIFLGSTSCEKYLEVPLPVDQLATESVFTSKPAIDATVIGIYSSLAGLIHAWDFGYTLYLSDELYYPSVQGSRYDLSIANINPTSSQVTSWGHYYTLINRANLVIENLPKVPISVLSSADNNRFMAEAKYLRAFANLYLAGFWGDAPLVLNSELEANLRSPRTPVSQVFEQIIKDLEDAKNLLPSTVAVSPNRIHNKHQVEALLARVYLYNGLWEKAEVSANNVITQNGYYTLLPSLADVFKRNSKETIFSLRESVTSSLFLDKTYFGSVLIQDVNVAMHPSILAKFETGDLRLTTWTTLVSGRRQPFKYIHSLTANASSNPQDFIIQRYAELYLVRAEARAQQGKLTGAQGAIADVNTIRTRASRPNTTAATQAEVLQAIEDERVRELFGEAHRWFDLKRTGKADQVLGSLPHKAPNYKPYMKFMPIDTRQIDANPSLTQTAGYN
jgi:hypothetical protein